MSAIGLVEELGAADDDRVDRRKHALRKDASGGESRSNAKPLHDDSRGLICAFKMELGDVLMNPRLKGANSADARGVVVARNNLEDKQSEEVTMQRTSEVL